MTFSRSTQDISKYAQRWMKEASGFFIQPRTILENYGPRKLRGDLIASLTVAVVLLPQAIAYALIAELPPQMGLYAAVVAAVFGALWGSSHHLHTGPTNTTSLLVLAGLTAVADPSQPEYIVAAAVMTIVAGVVRLLMGIARLGVLVNFVSDSVVVGFTAGAGILIVVNQMRHILRLSVGSSAVFYTTLVNIGSNISETHLISLGIGLLVIAVLLLLARYAPSWPNALIGMLVASAAVAIFGLNNEGVIVLGEIPRTLPPLASLRLSDFLLATRMAPSILAVALIGLVEAASISRAIAAQSGQYLDSDQEFVGQGMANIFAGIFSGYPVAGSLTRSAINYEAGAKTQMAAVFSGAWVLLAMLLFAPAAALLPRAALAAILIVTGSKMVRIPAIKEIWRTSRGDAMIMVVTFFGTLLLPLEFAVLVGVLISFARFIAKTSMPGVYEMLPDDEFEHFEHQPEKPYCPQLGVITIMGSLYFGAARHVENSIREHIEAHPEQKFLLLRMHRVNHCDISGIHMLESIVRLYRQRGGDVFMVGVRSAVWEKINLSDFDLFLGLDHFLDQEDAIAHIYYKILNPAICVYQCPVRAWKECQTLPKSDRPLDVNLHEIGINDNIDIPSLSPQELWVKIRENEETHEALFIDVREPLEYEQGHLRAAELMPMSEILNGKSESLPKDKEIILVCRTGRRSLQVARELKKRGFTRVKNLEGGMMALELAILP